jgi:DNA polymerase-3 subunit gamma/tau
MSYIALYRKWRSQSFDDVVGQKPIVQTLKNAIKNDRIAHAYLFSGPRGTGKTSVARIFAKALNCEKGPTDQPCGKCSMCSRIRGGHSVDVIEIDAASNRGIDEIRDLREKVRYAPVEGKYKVYIIDEVHMLTSEAFNALLKTLEEPPAHTIFVLATTELQKVPVTISSRCQRLDFARIPLSLIVKHLENVSKGEKFKIDDKALNLIARSSEGSMRDAISLLDQLVSFCGHTVKFDDVVMVLGTADEEFLFSMAEAMAGGDVAGALSLVEKAVSEGRSIPQVTKDLVGHIRYILLAKVGSESAIDLSREYIERLRADAERYPVERLMEIIRILSRAELDMKWHPHGRLILEVALVEAISEGDVREKKAAVEVKVSQPAPAVPAAPAVKKVVSEKQAGGGDLLFKIKENWAKILEAVKKKSLFGFVSLHEGAPLKIGDGGALIIGFKKGFSFHKERLEDGANKSAVESSIAEVVGEKVPIKCVVTDDIPEAPKKEIPKGGGGASIDSIKSFFSGKVVSGS